MLSSPPPDEPADASALRGRLFQDLDRLAFAIEMEAARMVERGEEAAAARNSHLRLGIRLAQRLVAGVWADEVDGRLLRWADEYDARLAPFGAGAAGEAGAIAEVSG